MTALDVWLLLCMLFVASALFEYAILLAIRYGKQNKVSAKIVGKEEDAAAIEKCRKIDLHALRVFIVLHVVKVCSFTAYILAARKEKLEELEEE